MNTHFGSWITQVEPAWGSSEPRRSSSKMQNRTKRHDRPESESPLPNSHVDQNNDHNKLLSCTTPPHGLGFYSDYITTPTRGLISDPCPLGLPVVLPAIAGMPQPLGPCPIRAAPIQQDGASSTKGRFGAVTPTSLAQRVQVLDA